MQRAIHSELFSTGMGVPTLVLALSLSLAADASAFTVRQTESGQTVRWHADRVVIAVDDSMLLIGDAEDVEAAVLSALGTWQARGAFRGQLAVGSTSGAQPGYQNRGRNESTIMALDGPWPWDPKWPAVTITTYDSITGEIVDADIVFDANRNWSTEGVPNAIDVQDVATHEVGHFLGLEHSEIPEATMFATAELGSTIRRTLHEDDVLGLTLAYGLDGESQGQEMEQVAGCGTAGGTSRAPSQVLYLLMSAMLLWIIRRPKAKA